MTARSAPGPEQGPAPGLAGGERTAAASVPDLPATPWGRYFNSCWRQAKPLGAVVDPSADLPPVTVFARRMHAIPEAEFGGRLLLAIRPGP